MSKQDKRYDFDKKFRVDEYGIWEVRGEDPNCDFGGHHHQPLLGYFEGKFKHVRALAITLDGWFTWGGGGNIKPNITRVDEFSVTKRSELMLAREQLKNRLKELDETLDR